MLTLESKPSDLFFNLFFLGVLWCFDYFCKCLPGYGLFWKKEKKAAIFSTYKEADCNVLSMFALLLSGYSFFFFFCLQQFLKDLNLFINPRPLQEPPPPPFLQTWWRWWHVGHRNRSHHLGRLYAFVRLNALYCGATAYSHGLHGKVWRVECSLHLHCLFRKGITRNEIYRQSNIMHCHSVS